MDVTLLLNQRCLLRLNAGGRGVEEYKVIEVSPSKNWVKLQNIYGNKFWKPVTDMALVEILVELTAGPPPNIGSAVGHAAGVARVDIG